MFARCARKVPKSDDVLDNDRFIAAPILRNQNNTCEFETHSRQREVDTQQLIEEHDIVPL